MRTVLNEIKSLVTLHGQDKEFTKFDTAIKKIRLEGKYIKKYKMISNYSPENDFPNNDDWDYIFKLMILIAILITLLAFALIFLTPEIFNYLITLNKEFFDTDKNFKPAEFMHFCSEMLKKEPKEKGQAPCMVLFCAFDQQMYFIELAKRYGLNNYINLVFRKNFSAQVLKANMKVVGNCEYGLIFYREKLPKFNNKGKMIFNCFDWERDDILSPLIRKIHPTQKPVKLLEKIIELFTDEGRYCY